jgi:small multidrug resistance family-3 protein
MGAALAEIGGAYLVWIGLREHKGALFVALGAIALALYGVIATFQPSHEFGGVLAACGGVFMAARCCGASPSTAFTPKAPTSPVRRSASPP